MKPLIIALLLALSACATAVQDSRNRISMGMDKAQVIGILGAPDRIEAAGNVECLYYDSNPWISLSDYSVFLESGRVVKYRGSSCSL